VRIRFVHAGVKETHVFHLHLYEWHAVPEDPNSPRIDAISVSPQTAHTIEPVWGAGNRHQVAGDVIWHCHLYPHFHEGMWGMFRTFETLQTGAVGAGLQSDASVYDGRRIGQYPDGTLIECLRPLPGRPLPPKPIPTHPGYPLYIPGAMQQKSPLPPWPATAGSLPDDYDYRPSPTDLEQNAFNGQPVPGELFTRNPLRSQQTAQWNGEPDNPADPTSSHDFGPNGGEREVHHDVVVEKQRIDYNGHGWHDKDGHLYYLEDEGNPDTRKNPDGSPRTKEPLFFRALHGQILNLTLHNGTPPVIKETEFDPPFPPCAALPWQGECAMHVHMVKFDPICADGASVGWNYISGPVHGKKMVYRWWLDQEFGTIFFHDHLFANYRQKHGLFGALLVEPIGAEFFDPFSGDKIVSGLQARVRIPGSVEEKVPLYSAMAGSSAPTNWFREFCIGIGDFIPMWDKDDRPLNPPDHPGGHGDQGVMALNYRSDPIHERLRDPTDPDGRRRVDPARWFSSLHPYNRDPFTTRFATFENDPIWFRAVQGSHEEQHSFQVHGMRWRRFRVNTGSPIRNQQTFGIAEAFTFINHEAYGPGDYLYKLSGADDLWLGCWGLIRAFRRAAANSETGGLLPLADGTPATSGGGIPAEVPATDDEPAPETALPAGAKFRHFRVIAERKKITYREPDLVDPFGLVYRLEAITDQDGVHYPVQASDSLEPMVLRCREDEWVKVTLVNKLPNGVTLRPEPFAPQVPVEEVNPFSFRPERPVSSQVSLHADLVTYDVTQDDGATVGRNPRQTVKPGEERTYAWNPARPRRRGDEPEPNAGEPLGPVLLQDMADFRNHRHHGLIGALVIEKTDATPYAAAKDEATASAGAPEAWNGARATVVRTGALPPEAERFEEVVLLLQDGLRLFLRGNIHLPIPDEAPAHGEEAVDHEDQGQKAFNYRSEPVGPSADPGFDSSGSNPPGDWLANPNPATPVWRVPAGQRVRFHFVGASDKPRNHSFTIHGVTWPEWRFKSKKVLPRVASESAITCGTGRTFEFTPQNPGDHAFRSGVLKWAVPQGLWGILRVVETGGKEGVTSSQDARNAATRSSRSYLGVAALTGAVVGLAVLLRNRRPKNAS
jgi:FtsP/CotA-like multicopper oxidase with cupredoxin domain